MIGLVLAAAVALTPADVIARYTTALAEARTPVVLTFEYALEQTGRNNAEQQHRVFRSGTDERDELLASDGKKLSPPNVRIYHRRPNRYTLDVLAPRPATYDFRFVGTRRDGRHVDYVFATTPRTPGRFAVTQVSIDSIAFLANEIAFATREHAGSGTVTFARFDRYWLPATVSARGMYGTTPTAEQLTFSNYRFPVTLPLSTFAVQPAVPDAAAAQ